MQAVRQERNVHTNNKHYPSLVQQALLAFLALPHLTRLRPPPHL